MPVAGQPLDTTWNSNVSLKLVCPKAVGFDVTRGTPRRGVLLNTEYLVVKKEEYDHGWIRE